MKNLGWTSESVAYNWYIGSMTTGNHAQESNLGDLDQNGCIGDDWLLAGRHVGVFTGKCDQGCGAKHILQARFPASVYMEMTTTGSVDVLRFSLSLAIECGHGEVRSNRKFCAELGSLHYSLTVSKVTTTMLG